MKRSRPGSISGSPVEQGSGEILAITTLPLSYLTRSSPMVRPLRSLLCPPPNGTNTSDASALTFLFTQVFPSARLSLICPWILLIDTSALPSLPPMTGQGIPEKWKNKNRSATCRRQFNWLKNVLRFQLFPRQIALHQRKRQK